MDTRSSPDIVEALRASQLSAYQTLRHAAADEIERCHADIKALMEQVGDQFSEIERLRGEAATPIDPAAVTRLIRWRDVGDGPISYVSGSQSFSDDVIALLREYKRLRAPAQPPRRP